MNNGRFAAGTIKRRLHFFKMMVDYGLKRGYCSRNPVIEAMKEWRGTVSKPVKTFDPEQVRSLLSLVSQRRHKGQKRPAAFLKCAVYIAAFCGLRRGEIMGLRLANVDLANRVLQIRHNLIDYDEMKGPKTRAGVRDVPMPGVLADMIQDWIASHYVANERELLFRTAEGSKRPMEAAGLLLDGSCDCIG